MTRRCYGCETSFETPYSTSKWCSDTCNERWKYRNQPWYKPRPKTPRSCKKCGVEFHSQYPAAKICRSCSGPALRVCLGCREDLPKKVKKFCASCRPLAWVIRNYGITIADYRRLQARSDGTCGICGGQSASRSRLSLDHCHVTGEPRGLLCNNCNAGLGMFRDSPSVMRKAIRYLEQRSMQFEKS